MGGGLGVIKVSTGVGLISVNELFKGFRSQKISEKVDLSLSRLGVLIHNWFKLNKWESMFI